MYANKVITNHHGGVILVGKYLYGYSDGKGWTCQDFATGKAVWQEKKKLGKGSLVYADGMLYLRAEAEQGNDSPRSKPVPKAIARRVASISRDRSDQNSWPHPVVDRRTPLHSGSRRPVVLRRAGEMNRLPAGDVRHRKLVTPGTAMGYCPSLSGRQGGSASHV